MTNRLRLYRIVKKNMKKNRRHHHHSCQTALSDLSSCYLQKAKKRDLHENEKKLKLFQFLKFDLSCVCLWPLDLFAQVDDKTKKKSGFFLSNFGTKKLKNYFSSLFERTDFSTCQDPRLRKNEVNLKVVHFLHQIFFSWSLHHPSILSHGSTHNDA